MLKTALLAALALVCVASNAEAHHKVQPAHDPMCNVPGGFPCDFSYGTPTTRKEAARVARGRFVARSLGIGAAREMPVVRLPRERPALSYGAPAPSFGSVGSGIVRSASGAVAHVSASATGAFQCVVNALEGQGYPVRFMGGFSSGHMRNSLHHTGMALDINQIGRGRTTPRMPGNEAALANSCGLISGSQWANNDSGHFQVGGWAGSGRHYASHRHRHYAGHHHRRHYASRV